MNSIENQYLDLLSEIVNGGVFKETRNGRVYSVFGRQIRHRFTEGFPLLTTKKMSLKNVFTELRWFLDGNTDIRYLWQHNCHIWDNDWYRWFKQNYDEDYTVEQLIALANDINTPDHFYDLGLVYGYQWRYSDGMDQVQNIINSLKNNPDDRRMLVSAWNINELREMALVPCHYSWQVWTRELTVSERFEIFNNKFETDISKDDIKDEHKEAFLVGIPKRAISLLFNARSQDVPLGTPYNIASYAMLLMMIANEVNMVPEELIGNLGDCHIYENQVAGVEEQLKRRPTNLPQLKIRKGLDAEHEDLELINYNPQPTIKFPLS